LHFSLKRVLFLFVSTLTAIVIIALIVVAGAVVLYYALREP